MKATQMICESIWLSLNTSMYSLWIDFNMTENSITLCGVSQTENIVTFFATLSRPKIWERLAEIHELKIRGAWSIFKRGTNTFQKKTTISVYLPIHDRNAVWKAKVKRLFTFVTDTSVSEQSLSQDCTSDWVDQRLAKLTVDDIRRTASQHVSDVSFTSISLIGSQTIRNPFTPVALEQYDDEFGHLRNNLPTKQWIQSVPTTAINESQPEEQSLGITFSDDMSFGRRSEDMSFGQYTESDNEIDDRFATGSRKSFAAAHSFSLENKHVKKFIAGTEPNDTCQEGLAAKQFSSPDKQHTEVTASASTVKPLVQQIESKDTTETISPSQRLNSFHRQLVKRKSFQKISRVQTSSTKCTTATASMSQNLNFSKINRPWNETDVGAGIASSQLCPCPPTSTHQQVDKENDGNRQHSPIGLEPNDAELQTDTEGMVFDAEGCVFANDDEVQDAFYVYIENNGLEYLTSESFKAANPVRRKRQEREFWAISKMISKVEDDRQSSSESITLTPRGTSKRKLWNDSANKYRPNEPCENDESGYSIPSNVSITSERFKKAKNSDEILDKSVDVAVHVPEPVNSHISVDDQEKTDSEKCASCAIMTLKTLIDYLTVFAETHETCKVHQLLLSQLIERLQSINKGSSTSEELFSTLLSKIKTICQQARQYTDMIIQKSASN